MLGMFQAMLKGRSLLEVKPDEEEFQREQGEVRIALDSELGDNVGQGAWSFLCRPSSYQPARWKDTETLTKIIEKTVVRVRREFPPVSHDLHVREWGICNRLFEDAFGLTRSGLFLSSRVFRENSFDFKNPWQPNPGIPAGQWLDFKMNLSLVIEFFLFMSRFADNFEIGEELVYEVVAEPITSRRLASMDGNIQLDPTDPCRATVFRRREVVSVESLKASWEESCVKASRVLSSCSADIEFLRKRFCCG